MFGGGAGGVFGVRGVYYYACTFVFIGVSLFCVPVALFDFPLSFLGFLVFFQCEI